MPIRADYVEDLALQQLESALRLYFEGKDFASVVTLAGAADEIFGKLLRASGRENSLDEMTRAVVAIQEKLYGETASPRDVAWRANHARNSLKHWDVGDPEIVKFDLPEEARDMLNRAIDNYWVLKETLTQSMEAFQRAQRAA
jgi:hypothetical protein